MPNKWRMQTISRTPPTNRDFANNFIETITVEDFAGMTQLMHMYDGQLPPYPHSLCPADTFPTRHPIVTATCHTTLFTTLSLVHSVIKPSSCTCTSAMHCLVALPTPPQHCSFITSSRSLHGNRLYTLPSDVFEGLINVDYLYECVGTPPATILLKVLCCHRMLNFNQLLDIEEDAFAGMDSLHYLYELHSGVSTTTRVLHSLIFLLRHTHTLQAPG